MSFLPPGLPRRPAFLAIVVRGEIEQVDQAITYLQTLAKSHALVSIPGRKYRVLSYRVLSKYGPYKALPYYRSLAFMGSLHNIQKFREEIPSVESAFNVSIITLRVPRPVSDSWFFAVLRAPSYPPLGATVSELEGEARKLGLSISTKFLEARPGSPRVARMRVGGNPEQLRRFFNTFKEVTEKYKGQGLEVVVFRLIVAPEPPKLQKE